MLGRISSRARLVLSALAFVLVLSALVYRTKSLLNVPGAPDKTQWGMQDFRDAVYYPVLAFLDGENPYDSARYKPQYPVRNYFPLYSPITLLIHLPFGLLPFQLSELVYYIGSVLVYLLLAWLALRFCHIEPAAWKVLGIATLIFMSRPGHNNLVLGQCAAQAVLFSLLAIQYARSRPALSGICLALATFKPTFGVPIFILMLFRRNYRACAIALSVGTVATAVAAGVLAAGAGGIGPLVESLTNNNAEFDERQNSSPETSFTRIDTISVVGRLGGLDFPTRPSLIIGLGMILVAGLTLRRLPPSSDEPDATGLSAAIICLTTLVCIYHQPPDLMLLTVTLLALAVRYGNSWSALNGAPRIVLIACLSIPAANYLATASLIRLFAMDGAVWTAVTSINGIALTVALVTCLGLAMRPAAPVEKVTLSQPSLAS